MTETPQATAARVAAVLIDCQTHGAVSPAAIKVISTYVHALADECDRLGKLLVDDARIVRDSIEADRRLWSGDVWGPNGTTILRDHFADRIAALPVQDDPDTHSCDNCLGDDPDTCLYNGEKES